MKFRIVRTDLVQREFDVEADTYDDAAIQGAAFSGPYEGEEDDSTLCLLVIDAKGDERHYEENELRTAGEKLGKLIVP